MISLTRDEGEISVRPETRFYRHIELPIFLDVRRDEFFVLFNVADQAQVHAYVKKIEESLYADHQKKPTISFLVDEHGFDLREVELEPLEIPELAAKTKLDPALVRKGRLQIEHEFGPLDPQHAQRLLATLGVSKEIAGQVKEPMTLADIYNLGWKPVIGSKNPRLDSRSDELKIRRPQTVDNYPPTA